LFSPDVISSRRCAFTLRVSGDFLIERVVGKNVRQRDSEPEGSHQKIVVSLLKELADQGSFTVLLPRRDTIGEGEIAEFATPLVNVTDTALQ